MVVPQEHVSVPEWASCQCTLVEATKVLYLLQISKVAEKESTVQARGQAVLA